MMPQQSILLTKPGTHALRAFLLTLNDSEHAVLPWPERVAHLGEVSVSASRIPRDGWSDLERNNLATAEGDTADFTTTGYRLTQAGVATITRMVDAGVFQADYCLRGLTLPQRPQPILLNLPDTIQTERLQLTILKPGDGAPITEVIETSFDELNKWMPWCKELPKADAIEDFCRQTAANFAARGTSFDFVATLPESGEIIGAAGFARIVWDVPLVEIGYWIGNAHAGKGYATEITKALIEYAFNEMKAVRVEIRMDARNTASERVAIKAGARHEGTFHADARDNAGQLRDTKLYAVLAETIGVGKRP